jgi:hypothetical protein
VLEDRLAPAVTAVLNGTTLNVTLNASGDIATLVGDTTNNSISVNGKAFTGVQSINITGNNLVTETVNLNGAANLTGSLRANQISDVNINGTYKIGGSLSLSTNTQPSSSLTGEGAFTVVGSTGLTTSGTIELAGANDFQGAVSVIGGKRVFLSDSNKLTVKLLFAQENATLEAGDIDLTGTASDYRSKNRGVLFFFAASPTQSITIGGSAEGYHLSQSDITKLGDTFSELRIGDPSDNNPITIQGMRFYTGTSIQTAGSITVNGEISSGSPSADLRLLSAKGTILNAGVRSGGGDVTFFGPVTLGTPGTIQVRTSAGGAPGHGIISFRGTVNDDATPTVLQITSANDVDFDAVGDVIPPAGVEITSARSVFSSGSMGAGYIKQVRGTGTTTLRDVVVTSPGTPFDLTTSHVSLLGNITATGQTVQLNITNGVDQMNTTGLKAAALALKGGGSFQLTGFDNDVATLAASLTGDLTFHDLNTVTVGTVGTIQGIRTLNQDVTLDLEVGLIIGSGAGEDMIAGTAKVTLKSGLDGVVEKTGSSIVAAGLQLMGLGTFDLSQPNNNVQTLFATINGNLNYRDRNALAIGDGVAATGISTNAGTVQITTGGILTVLSRISTLPGSGGMLKIVGKESDVQIKAPIDLGAGDVTFVVTEPPPMSWFSGNLE